MNKVLFKLRIEQFIFKIEKLSNFLDNLIFCVLLLFCHFLKFKIVTAYKIVWCLYWIIVRHST